MRRLAVIFVLLLFGYLTVKTLSSSFFFLKKDRINLVIYGQNTAIYSLGLGDNTNYFIPFDAATRVIVPGGYGEYRVGAVGKLASLDTKPALLKQAFSLSTGSFVDIYFYPKTSDIYYHAPQKSFFAPSLSELLFLKSNANIFERLYISYLLTVRSRNQFKTLKFLSSNTFYKNYQGNFYSPVYRSENLNLQIIYTKSYNTAVLLSRILEGEGIHIVDISSAPEASKTNLNLASACEVEDNLSNKFSETAKAVALFFGCRLKHGNSMAYDILISLGEVEGIWNTEVKN